MKHSPEKCPYPNCGGKVDVTERRPSGNHFCYTNREHVWHKCCMGDCPNLILRKRGNETSFCEECDKEIKQSPINLNDLQRVEQVELLVDNTGKLWVNSERGCLLRIGHVTRVSVNLHGIKKTDWTVR